jgi:hypothetical protein
VRKGFLHNISGEFHYKDLQPKVKQKKKETVVAKKLEWFVLLFHNTPDESTHAHRDSRTTTTKRYMVVGVRADFLVFGRWNSHTEGKERVTCTETSIADWRTKQNKYHVLATSRTE